MTAPRLGHAEIEELLGAYALDAVEPDEAAAVAEHLRECPRCRDEVATHRATAAMLADTHAQPPSELWDRVAARLDAPPPPLDLSRLAGRSTPRRAPVVWGRVAAAAAAVVAVTGLGITAYEQERDVEDLREELAGQELAVDALAAFDEPGARHATLRAADGSLQVRAVLLPDGSGYLLADRLPALPGDRTYQLWAMVGGEPVSAGVLGADPGVVAFRADEAADALAISEEPLGGAERPTLPARFAGPVQA